MRTAEIGVVDDIDVAFLRWQARAGSDHLDDRFVEYCMTPTKTGRPCEPWAISAPSTRVNAIGAVVGFGDDRRECRPGESQVHLVADLLEGCLDHREGDGVEAHGISGSSSPEKSAFLPDF